MKRDWRAHPVSNVITFIGVLLSFFLVSYCMLFGEKYRSFDKKQEEAFVLICNIAAVRKDITAEQAEHVLKGYEEIAKEYSIKYAGIEDFGGQKILNLSDGGQEADKLSAGDVADIRNLINVGELCFVMRDDSSLQEGYDKLVELCGNNGFEICINDHKEMDERKTIVAEKLLYLFIKYGTMLFSTIFLLILVFLWFDTRRHEWFIRNICGQSVGELLAESTKILLVFIVVAYLIVILLLSAYKPASTVDIIKYGSIGFAEAVLCVILFSVKYSNIKR